MRVVLASANDVGAERQLAEQVIKELNSPTGELLGIIIKLVRWEDLPPGLHHGGSQGYIDDAFRIPECELVVGVFSMRLGAGTEHEVRKAYDAWKNQGKPQLMLYFRQKGKLPETAEEIDNLSKIISFKEELRKKRPDPFYKDYSDSDDFRLRLHDHLIRKMFEFAASRSLLRSPDTALVGAASAIARSVRIEGITERVGDIDITLGTSREQLEISADFTVFLNTNITNRLSDGNMLEDVKLVEVHQGRQQTAPPITAKLVGLNTALFPAIPLKLRRDAGSIVFRVAGLRANAVQLGLTATLDPTEVVAYVRIETPETEPLLLNPQLTVGLAYPTYIFRVASPANRRPSSLQISQRDGLNWDLRESETCNIEKFGLFLNFRDLLIGVLSGVNVGPDQTHLCVRFHDIPDGVELLVSAYDIISEETPIAQSAIEGFNLQNYDPSEVPLRRLTVSEGSAEAVWVAPTRFTLLSFGVLVCCKRGASLGTCEVTGMIMPMSTVHTASTDAPVPRFAQLYPWHYVFSVVPE